MLWKEGGYPERFQHLKELSIAALLLGVCLVAYRLRTRPEETTTESAPEDDLADYRERVRREISS